MQALVLILISIYAALAASFSYGQEESSSRLRWSAGAGLEGRIRQDINPDLPDTKVLPPLFMQIHGKRLSAQLEFTAFEEKKSTLGALEIESETYTLGGWGRYAFKEPFHWSPFAAAGGGVFFDRVESSYLEESTEVSGRRYFMGLGGGVTHELIPHLEIEGEIRAALIEDRKDVSFSGIIRLGVLL